MKTQKNWVFLLYITRNKEGKNENIRTKNK